jgi:hypothetical protein
MTGLFALLYAFAARRLAPWRALATAALPAVLLTGMVSGLGGSLTMSLVGACLMLVACRQLMPNATPARRRVVHWRRDLLLTMAVSGAVTILMSLIAPRVPPLLCGLVAAIPVVGMSTTVSVHAQGGSGTVTAFLQAYVQGLFAKVAFLGALAATLQLSAGPWPWLVAVAGGTAVVMVVSKWPWPTAPAEEPASCAAEPAPPALSPPPTLSAARPG